MDNLRLAELLYPHGCTCRHYNDDRCDWCRVVQHGPDDHEYDELSRMFEWRDQDFFYRQHAPGTF